MKKIRYTWQQFNKDINLLAQKFKKQVKIGLVKNIYGIPRGGLIVAVSLSHKLGVPVVIDYKQISHHTLIVDDICDSGTTLRNLILPAGLYKIECGMIFLSEKIKKYPKESRPQFVRVKKDNTWIVYPWEDYKKENGYSNGK